MEQWLAGGGIESPTSNVTYQMRHMDNFRARGCVRARFIISTCEAENIHWFIDNIRDVCTRNPRTACQSCRMYGMDGRRIQPGGGHSSGITPKSSRFGFRHLCIRPDDAADIKGDLLKVTRDNVVYEAGLFSGFLASDRCFIAVPQSVRVRIPTDLLGMTLGSYEDQRMDGNSQAAVSSFCLDVEARISTMGLFTGLPDDELRELATQFECCDWIPDSSHPVDPSDVRVAKKARSRR